MLNEMHWQTGINVELLIEMYWPITNEYCLKCIGQQTTEIESNVSTKMQQFDE
jgi:hypothetical protein